jgi:FPC/CPF motif-containing protein YcgG
MQSCPSTVVNSFQSFISNADFPCVAAKDALAKHNIKILIAQHIACPADDERILAFMYDFTDAYRRAEKGFHSAAIIFELPENLNEDLFDNFMWQRLRSLRKLDEQNYQHDPRVNSDPTSPGFGFSLKEEAYFIVGLHANNSRPGRQFKYPTLIFNPHAQFEVMKTTARFVKMKAVVRKKDIALAGSVNPMLTDFGEASEVYQYSGKLYDTNWKCPLIPS